MSARTPPPRASRSRDALRPRRHRRRPGRPRRRDAARARRALDGAVRRAAGARRPDLSRRSPRRRVTRSARPRRRLLGAARRSSREFAASGAQYVPGATVWSLTPELRDRRVDRAAARARSARKRVILATGALERPFPIPGWTLPGVMTAGAAQTLLKSSALVPDGRTVLAGSGRCSGCSRRSISRAGAKIDAILDTTPRRQPRARPGRTCPAFVRSPLFRQGPGCCARCSAACDGDRDVTDIARRGRGQAARASSYRVGRVGATRASRPTTCCCTRASCPTSTSRWRSASPIAGTTAALLDAGARRRRRPVRRRHRHRRRRRRHRRARTTAAARGTVAAGARRCASSARPQRRPTHERAVAALAALRRAGALSSTTLYRPAKAFRVPVGDTIVCRCEEVTAQQIVDTVALGCAGPNQMKSFLRCGMGPCQGRLCGLDRHRADRRARAASTPAGGRLLPPAPAGQADHPRASLPRCRRARRRSRRSSASVVRVARGRGLRMNTPTSSSSAAACTAARPRCTWPAAGVQRDRAREGPRRPPCLGRQCRRRAAARPPPRRDAAVGRLDRAVAAASRSWSATTAASRARARSRSPRTKPSSRRCARASPTSGARGLPPRGADRRRRAAALLPALAPHCVGGVVCRGRRRRRCRSAPRWPSSAAAESLGVRFVEGTRAQALRASRRRLAGRHRRRRLRGPGGRQRGRRLGRPHRRAARRAGAAWWRPR